MHWSKLWFIEKILPREKIEIVGQCQPDRYNENEWKYICSQCWSLNFLGFHKIKLELTLSLLRMYPIFLFCIHILVLCTHPLSLSHMCTSSLPSCNFFPLKEIFLTSSISFKTKNWISAFEAIFFWPHDHYYHSLDLLVKSSSSAAVTAGQRDSQILP